jgi:translocator protein
MAIGSAAESRLRSSGVIGRDAALILDAVGGTAGIGAAATTTVLSSRWYRRLKKPSWTLIFFRGRSPLAAGVEIVALEGTTVGLVVRAWPLSRLAALLLVPSAIWIGFATALTWAIWARN